MRTLGKPVFHLIDGFKSNKKPKTQPKNLRSVKNAKKIKTLNQEAYYNTNARRANNYYNTEPKVTEELFLDENGNVVDYQQVDVYDPTLGKVHYETYETEETRPKNLKICTCCGELYEADENENVKNLRKTPEIDETVIKKGGKTQLVVKNFEKNLDEPCEDLLDFAAEENIEEDENQNNQILASENKILEENILKLPLGL